MISAAGPKFPLWTVYAAMLRIHPASCLPVLLDAGCSEGVGAAGANTRAHAARGCDGEVARVRVGYRASVVHELVYPPVALLGGRVVTWPAGPMLASATTLVCQCPGAGYRSVICI